MQIPHSQQLTCFPCCTLIRRLIPVALLLAPAAMTEGQAVLNPPVLVDDAEQAIYEPYISNGWTPNAGNISVTQAVVHSGKYAYQVTPGSSGYRGVTMGFSPIYLGCWIYVPATFSLASGASSGVICGLLSTTSWVTSGVGLTSSGGQLYLSGSGLPMGTHPVTTNSWHFVEYRYGTTATVWLDGTQDATGSMTTGAKNNVLIGMLASAGSGSIYVDDITVSASKSANPTAGLTVRHAYPTNRTAMKVQTYLWGAASTDSLVVSIDGAATTTIVNPGTYQEPVVQLSGLSAGSHTLQVALEDSSGATRVSSSENITAYGGTPTVAIDENNNLVRGGHKIFPVTGWFLGGNALPWFQAGYTNAGGWATGYDSTYTATTYQQYLESSLDCLSTGMTMMGPLNQRIQGTCAASDTTCATEAAGYAAYAAALKNHQCVLAWTGFDEASVQGWSVSRLQGAMNAVHSNDNNHPFTYDDASYPYLHLEWYYPALVADIYSTDNYPLCYAIPLHAQKKQMSDWVAMLDRDARANYGLVPNFNILELYKFTGGNFDCTSNNSVTNTAVSAATIYNEAWMAVIHGRKGIGWYDNGSATTNYAPVCASDAAGSCFPTGPQNHIEKFVSAIASITPDVVLAAPTGRTVASNRTTNCNSTGPVLGQRVDAAVREDSSNVWVFAARLTDPLCTPGEDTAPAVTTQFTVSSLGNATAAVFGENRNVAVSNGVFTDSFAPWDVHIYKIPKGASTTPPAPLLNPAVAK